MWSKTSAAVAPLPVAGTGLSGSMEFSPGAGASGSLTAFVRPPSSGDSHSGRKGSVAVPAGGKEQVDKKQAKLTWSPFRLYIHRLVRSDEFNNAILFVIFLNSVLITLQMVQSTNQVAAYWFDVTDKILMGIYVLELSLKLFAYQTRFGDSGWNLFDAFIVSISLVETAVTSILASTSSVSPSIFRLFRVFKALRAMRAIRAVSFLKNLQVIIVTLLKSIPAMGSIILLLMLILYIFAIIFVTLYKDVYTRRFGNLWIAMFTLFELITMDDWTLSYYELEPVDPAAANQMIILMAVFIVLETFICINLFIAVIVNNLERANAKDKQRKLREAEDTAAAAGGEGGADAGAKRTQRGRDRAKRKQKKKGKDKKGNGNGEEDDTVAAAAAKSSKKDAAEAAPDSDSDEEGLDELAFVAGGHNPSDLFIQDPTLPFWQRELQPEILALIASIDHQIDGMHRSQRLLDELVDVTQATGQQPLPAQSGAEL